ncbi:MAG: ATP-dependent RNA helicase [Lysobacteraceae bacterium]|nr:MAG: ATP-dependent RNA helicase [Xanthomonadaceae bacterium]
MNHLTFASLSLKPALLDNLATLGFKVMTPIQAHSLPAILDGQDVIGQGKTGSGKTAAFGLGLLQALDVKLFRIQALVLCPTRELADQVAKDIRNLARAIHNIKVLTLCGGMPFGPQLGSLSHGAHIVVGTPGRIEDHVNRGTLMLDHVRTLVLDEADRMLDMGFQPALDSIVERVPRNRQTLLFSATYPRQIEQIADRVMRQPKLIRVESKQAESTIEQRFYRVTDQKHRFQALRLLLLQHQPTSALVFCNTKLETQQVADGLGQAGFSAKALHGDLEQRDRDQTLVMFSNNSVSVLVATDVAARGLDIDALDLVINYQIAHDGDVHLHRVGRTGRAGSKGIACSLFGQREQHKLAMIECDVDPLTEHQPLPADEVLQCAPPVPSMVTLLIDGGKKHKLRPGDVLGALTAQGGVQGSDVGKIQSFDLRTYVAVGANKSRVALKKLTDGKLKGRNFRARLLR